MKQIGIVLLLVAVGLAGYFLAYEKIVRDMLGIPKPLRGPAKSLPVYVEEKTPEAPKPKVQEKPKVVEAPKPKPVKPVEAPKPKVEAPKVVSNAEADGFVPPTFPSIEQATKNWTEIPRGAFTHARAVTIKKPVEYVSGFGKSTVPAGSVAYAVGQEGNLILVAPSPTSQARGKIALEDTDIKDVITKYYASFMVEETNRLRLAYRQGKAAGTASALGAIPERQVVISNLKNDRPAKNKDGLYPPLLLSMQQGKVTEVTKENITKVSDPTPETVDGKDYWVIVVDYTTKTVFGEFKTAAKAYVINGAVEKWIYVESGELVP